MKSTKYTNRDGSPKGASIYSLKKDGSRYAKPEFIAFIGNETTAEDIVKRLEKLNPSRRFEIA